MAYIRNRDIKKVGKSCVEEDRGVILTKVKHGCNAKIRRMKNVPMFNMRGKRVY